MPRSANYVPRYSKHKGSGLAVVTIRGKDHYLGPYGTKASHLEYDRLIMEWLAAGRPTEDPEAPDALKVKDVVLGFWKFAQKHYRKNGQPTGTAENYKVPLRLLRRYYGDKPAAEFGPKSLKALRHKMILDGNSRNCINDSVDKIRRVFRWALSEELIPAAVVTALESVRGLPKDRSEARETEPVTRPLAKEQRGEHAKGLTIVLRMLKDGLDAAEVGPLTVLAEHADQVTELGSPRRDEG